MVHKVTLKSNPRILIIFALVVVLPVLSAVVAVRLSLFIGVIALLLSVFFDYQMIRFVGSQFRSYIETDETVIRCSISGEELVELRWEDISHSGFCLPRSGRRFVFLYSEEKDKLLTIPDEYSDFDQLIARLKELKNFRTVSLTSNETIQDYLRRELENS